MTSTHPLTIVAADHPSLEGAIGRFLDELRHETRFFGPSGSANPEPFAALVEGLSLGGDDARGTCFGLAVLDGRRTVALARVEPDGQVLVAVSPDRRGEGVGTVLARAVVERARALGFVRLRLRSSRRSRAATSLATCMGFMVIERGAGRIDLVLDLAPASHTA